MTNIIETIEPFVGRTFMYSTMTESSISAHYDGHKAHLMIQMDDGKTVRTIRRQYSRKFLDQFAGFGKWNENNLTQVLLGIYILDPKGLYQLTRAPRECLSALIDTYRKDFMLTGTLFYMTLELTKDTLKVTSQRQPDIYIQTRSIKEVTKTTYAPVMTLGFNHTPRRRVHVEA
ncbi:hypothetical protein [Vibrio phage phiKT1028]|nr:hypothetical protein [Vibrio phage phiKT1028]